MKSFRTNLTENMTANIIWQYVTQIVDDTYQGTDNVMILNSKYQYYNMNKVTEIVTILNGHSIRVECKYLSKGSNYGTAIALDLVTLSHCKEEYILFVLDGEGYINNKLVDALKLDIANGAFFTKNIKFVMLADLDSYIRDTYKVTPDWNKKASLMI